MPSAAPSQPLLSADPNVDDFNFGDTPNQSELSTQQDYDSPSHGLPPAFPIEQIEEANREPPAPRPQPQRRQPDPVRQDEGARPPVQRAQTSDPGDVVFPPELLRQYGLTEQEARSYGFQSPEQLEAAIALHDRQMLRAAMPQQQFGQPQFAPQFGQSFGQPPIGQPQPQFQQPNYQAPPVAPVPPTQIEPFKVDLNPEHFDEQAIKAFNGLNEYHTKIAQSMQQEVQFLRQALQTIVGHTVSQQEQQNQIEFDEAINGLSEDYRELFGQGTINELQRGSLHWMNRAQLDRAVEVFQANRQQRGLPRLKTRDAVQRVVRAEYPKQHDTTVRKQVTSEAARRQRNFTAAPSGRRGTGGGDPISNAVAGVEKIYERSGFNAPADTEDETF